MNYFVKLATKYEWLRHILPFTNGFNHKKEKDEESHLDDVMGASERFDWQILKPEGDWLPEAQGIKMEYQNWMDCTGHGMKNAIEMLALAKFGETWNLSAAYINGMANTSKYNGNSMKTILETVRKYGVVTDEDWPEENRWKTIPQSVINKGITWTKEYDFGYDLVASTKKALDWAVQFSPLYVAGYAWYRKGMNYISAGNPNHCFTEIKNLQKIAKDSYDPDIKHLDPAYKLYYVRRLYLGKKNAEYNGVEIQKLIARGLKYIIRVFGKGEVYELLPDKLVKVEPQEIRNMTIKSLQDAKKIVGIDEGVYNKLLI